MLPSAFDQGGEPLAFQFLVTAAEAYPAFEDAVLDAKTEIAAGFRIFDLSTPLKGVRARAVGQDWFDLFLHALRRGVSIRLVISDFDPIVGEELHAMTWRTLRMGSALRELAPDGAQISMSAALHPARLAWIARLALWPQVQMMLAGRARALTDLPTGARARALEHRPGLRAQLVEVGGRLRPRRLLLPKLAPVTHHQKVAVIDGRRLYCGGLDLNERRYDTALHERPADETWHDVQVLLDDPEAAGAAIAHLEEFVAVTHRETKPRPSGRILRTLSARTNRLTRPFSPRTVTKEVEEAVLDGIRSARNLIYIETQFLRDRRIARALAKAAVRIPSLRLFLVLPAAPDDVAFGHSDGRDARFGEFLQARCVQRVRRAFGARAFIGSPVRPVASTSGGRDSLHGSPLIYVHAKVSLFDDDLGIVSSANLNGRSMRWDTEFGVPIRDSGAVSALRGRLLGHWLGLGATGANEATADTAASLCDAQTCVGAWRAQAARNATISPDKRVGLLVPYRVGPGRQFGRALPFVPEEIV